MSLKHKVYGFYLSILNRVKFRKVSVQLNGINWSLKLNNALDVHLLHNGGHYHKVMPKLLSVFNKNLAAIDVGANRGYWTLPLARHFQFVFSIEADLDNFQGLIENISVNPLLSNRIIAQNVAATNYDGVAKLNIRRSIDADANLNTGLSSLVILERNSIFREVKAVQIDSVVSSTAPHPRVCFIKIDVEGAEFEVLTGTGGLIRNDSPAIFWEATLSLDAKFGRGNVRRCWELLEDLAYKHFLVFENGEIQECPTISELNSLGFDIDILSVHSSNVDDFLHRINLQ